MRYFIYYRTIKEAILVISTIIHHVWILIFNTNHIFVGVFLATLFEWKMVNMLDEILLKSYEQSGVGSD